MPVFQKATTLEDGKLVWQSPDGQRKIYEVLFDIDGKENFKANTYSERIIVKGWSGSLESYEKSNRTFVRQHRDEQAFSYKGGASKPMTDPFTMYLSYAKDLVVAKITTLPDTKVPPIEELVQQTVKAAYELYGSRPDAPKEAETQELSLDA